MKAELQSRNCAGNMESVPPPFYKWRAKYGGIDASLMARLKELEDKNRRLKKMYAEEKLKAEIIKKAMEKSDKTI
jgi:putative transposase